MELKYRWVEKFKKVPKDFLNEFKDYPSFLKQIFWGRGLKNKKEIDHFLNPNWKTDIHNPELLSNIKKAAKRIIEAVEKNQKIIICGDYDTDGVSGSTLLNDFFKRIDFFNFEVFLPDRREGYGLSGAAVKRFHQKKTNLIITNDCGITNVEEVALANKLGIDVIVTDHHLPQKELPPALAIVDHKLSGDKYPFKWLCGAGVVFKLIQEILNLKKYPFKESFEKWSSDILAISAIADWVPLIDENRVFVKYGLITLNKTKRLGLKALKKIAGLEGEVSARDVGFSLVPMLNSASRMDHANTAFEALTTESEAEADWLAKRLDVNNKRRQNEARRAYQEAISMIKEPLPKIIALGSPAWNLGTISNLASRLKEEFFRPVFIWQEKLLEAKGSARSIEKFNLVEAMEEISKKHNEFFISFGGHAVAAGFNVKSQYLKSFLEEINKIADKKITDEDLIPTLEIDAELVGQDINQDFFEKYKSLEPFGVGNKEPNFLIRNAKILNVASVGNNGDHLKLKINWQGKIYDSIGFGQGSDWQKIRPDDKLDIVFNVRKNDWQGVEKLDLFILDWKKSK